MRGTKKGGFAVEWTNVGKIFFAWKKKLFRINFVFSKCE